MQETQDAWVRTLSWEEPLEEGMATHSSILAWRTPWTEEPGGLQSIGLQGQTRLKRLSTHTTCVFPILQDYYFLITKWMAELMIIRKLETTDQIYNPIRPMILRV